MATVGGDPMSFRGHMSPKIVRFDEAIAFPAY
jgi:hypothetical protein